MGGDEWEVELARGGGDVKAGKRPGVNGVGVEGGWGDGFEVVELEALGRPSHATPFKRHLCRSTSLLP